MFPTDRVPDGAVFAPHHYTYSLLLALLVAAVVWDNYDSREPVLTVALVGSGLFGFLSVWPYYPVAGAVLSLVGAVGAVVVVLSGWVGFRVGDVWDEYPIRYRLALVGATVAGLDDAVEHAFGIPTPLDTAWGVLLRNGIGPTVIAGGVLAVVVGAAAVEYVVRGDSRWRIL